MYQTENIVAQTTTNQGSARCRDIGRTQPTAALPVVSCHVVLSPTPDLWSSGLLPPADTLHPAPRRSGGEVLHALLFISPFFTFGYLFV